jgi:GNAT superfamily N-acetyltransferase
MTDSTRSLRNYKQGDENEIRQLFNTVFKIPRSIEYWLWEFRNNPGGQGIIAIAEDKGEIVGHYSILPIKMTYSGNEILGAQSVDTMTHPEYQHQGIFIKLAREVYQEAASHGISVIWGLPNEKSLPGFKSKLDWITVGTIPGLVKVVNANKILKRFLPNSLIFVLGRLIVSASISLVFRTKKVRIIDKVSINQIKIFNHKADLLWQKIRNDFGIAVIKSSEYLNWRYVNHPDGQYIIFTAERDEELQGFIVLKIVSPLVGHIVDILVIPTETHIFHRLISKAIEFFRQANIGVIYCYILDDRYYQIFKRNGFKAVGSELVLGVRANSTGISEAWLKDTGKWHITFGDSDGI